MAMKHSGNEGERAAAVGSEAEMRAPEEMPPGSVPFGAAVWQARTNEAGGGQEPG